VACLAAITLANGRRAAKAHEIVKELGVAWNEILVFPEGKQELAEIRRCARKLLKHEELFSEFEIKFLNLKRYTRPLSQRGRAVTRRVAPRAHGIAWALGS
jgi:hypothetical protein